MLTVKEFMNSVKVKSRLKSDFYRIHKLKNEDCYRCRCIFMIYENNIKFLLRLEFLFIYLFIILNILDHFIVFILFCVMSRIISCDNTLIAYPAITVSKI